MSSSLKPIAASVQVAPLSQVGAAALQSSDSKAASAAKTRFSLIEYFTKKPVAVTNKADPAYNYLGAGSEGVVSLQKTMTGKDVAFKQLNPDRYITLYPGMVRGDFVVQMENENFANAKGFVVRKDGEDTVYASTEALNKDIEALEKKIAAKKDIIKLEQTLAQLKSKSAASEEISAAKKALEDARNKLRFQIVGLIMEPLKGETLFDLVSRQKLNVRTVIDLSLQILKALDIMHSSELVHRDVKLENLFLVEGKTVKICDFGMTRKADERMATRYGSSNYIAPEILLGKPYDHTIDNYSAGIVIFALALRGLPFTDENDAVICQKVARYGSIKHGSFETPGMVTVPWIQNIRKANPILADVIVGLTKSDPDERLELWTAVSMLEAARVALQILSVQN